MARGCEARGACAPHSSRRCSFETLTRNTKNPYARQYYASRAAASLGRPAASRNVERVYSLAASSLRITKLFALLQLELIRPNENENSRTERTPNEKLRLASRRVERRRQRAHRGGGEATDGERWGAICGARTGGRNCSAASAVRALTAR